MCTDFLITYLPTCSRRAAGTGLRVLKYDTKEKGTLYHQVIQKRRQAAFGQDSCPLEKV